MKSPLFSSLLVFAAGVAPAGAQTLFPADQATGVNPDVQLKLTFEGEPRAGTSGKIVIHDAADGGGLKPNHNRRHHGQMPCA